MEMNTVARTRLDKWLVISKLVVSNDELVVTVLTTWNWNQVNTDAHLTLI
jgi:hypothetical protein